jgi:hypothetical protein
LVLGLEMQEILVQVLSINQELPKILLLNNNLVKWVEAQAHLINQLQEVIQDLDFYHLGLEMQVILVQVLLINLEPSKMLLHNNNLVNLVEAHLINQQQMILEMYFKHRSKLEEIMLVHQLLNQELLKIHNWIPELGNVLNVLPKINLQIKLVDFVVKHKMV